MNLFTTVSQRVKAATDLLFRGNLRNSTPYHARYRMAGVPVTEETAMMLSAYFACLRIVAETIGSPDWRVYELGGQGQQVLRNDHPNDYLLSTRPNAEMTSTDFRRAMMMWHENWGNAYAEIQFSNNPSYISGLWPIPAHSVMPRRNPDTLELEYLVNSGVTGESDIPVPANRMLHWRGLSWDGIVGLSRLTQARTTLSVNLAMDQFQQNFYQRGAMLTGTLNHPAKLGPDGPKKIKDSFRALFGGVQGDDSMGVAVLEEGMEFKPLTMPLKDAEFILSRKFQLQEIARWFRMPLHKLGDLSDAKYANIEQQQIEFVMETILPVVKAIHQETNYKLFGNSRVSKFAAIMDISELTQGDMKTRYEAYGLGRQWGFLTADDVRRREKMNDLPRAQNGGLTMWPGNMIPQQDADTYFQKDPTPPAAANTDQTDTTGDETTVPNTPARMRPAAAYNRIFTPDGNGVIQ